MNIEKKYKEIIPLDDYEHRRDFYNEDLIDKLNTKEKILIENMLISDLKSKHDLLIIETLVYIRSLKSIKVIEERLNKTKEPFDKIVIAWCLYNLNRDKEKMVGIAYDNFQLINNDYSKTSLFFYLAKFNESKLNDLIKSYIDNNNFLLSNNALRSLKLQNG